jgi:hypothetical protein
MRELLTITGELKKYLALRIYRQEAQRMHQHGLDQRKDK